MMKIVVVLVTLAVTTHTKPNIFVLHNGLPPPPSGIFRNIMMSPYLLPSVPVQVVGQTETTQESTEAPVSTYSHGKPCLNNLNEQVPCAHANSVLTYGDIVSCNSLEKRVNSYRQSLGLNTLKCDKRIRQHSLLHAYDQTDSFKKYPSAGHFDDDHCNGHGWFIKKWKGDCGYCKDKCVYEKRIGSWPFGTWSGFAEISHWHSAKATSSGAVEGWKGSPGHNSIMKGKYKRIGCEKYGKYANCNLINY